MKEFETSVGFILVNDNKQFLIIRKAVDGVWDFPKGHFNKGETDEHLVALREVEEETGINKKDLHEVKGFRKIVTFVNPKGSHRMLVLFLAVCNEEPKLSAEHTEYKWAGFEEAKKLMFFKEQQSLVDEAYKKIRELDK